MAWHGPLSLLFAAVYLVSAAREAGPGAAAVMLVPLGLLVWLIWDPDTAADFTGNLGFTPIRRRSPAGLVRGAAWVFLLMPAIGWLLSLVGAGA